MMAWQRATRWTSVYFLVLGIAKTPLQERLLKDGRSRVWFWCQSLRNRFFCLQLSSVLKHWNARNSMMPHVLFLARCSCKFGPGRLKGSPSWPTLRMNSLSVIGWDGWQEQPRWLQLWFWCWKRMKWSYSRTDAELLISIDPIFVGFFSTSELLLNLALCVYLSLNFLAMTSWSQKT